MKEYKLTVKELRQKLNMTQKEFGEHFDIPFRTIGEWEQGRKQPPYYVLEMIERIINLELEKKNNSF